MTAGISTACLYPEQTEKALEWVVANGVACAEVFFNADSELEDGFLRGLKAIAQGGGCQILSLHPFSSAWEPMLLFSSYDRRTEDGFRYYEKYFRAANILEAGVLVLHGAYRWQDIDAETYCRRYSRLQEMGKRYGVQVAQENVVRFKVGDLDFLREVRGLLPEMCFTLDTKQAHRSGYDPLEVVKVMGKGLCHVHISDKAPRHDCVPVGEGQWDYQSFLRRLQDWGYTGGVIQEVYRDSYTDVKQVFEGYQVLANTIANL